MLKALCQTTSCRCASTSTAKPCTHALTRALATAIDAKQTTSPSSHHPALTYPAPLWEKHFKLRKSAWRVKNWISESKLAPSEPRTDATSLLEPPPRSLSLLDEIQDERRRRLRDYLSLRAGSIAPLSRAEAVDLIRAARESYMPAVARMIADDIEERETMLDEKATTEMFVAQLEKSRPSTASFMKEDGEDVDISNMRGSLVNFLDSAPVRGQPLPLELSILADTPLGALENTWTRFSAGKLVRTGDPDTALKFLLYLTSPSSSDLSVDGEYTPLAVRILNDLLQFSFSDLDIDAALSLSPAHRELLAQDSLTRLLILRSVATLATEINAAGIFGSAIRGLAALTAQFPAPLKENTVEQLIFINGLHTILDRVAEDFTSEHRPSALKQSDPIVIVHSLLIDFGSKGVSVITKELTSALDAFASVAAQVERWDLLASVWLAFGWTHRTQKEETRWELRQHQRKLLRWLMGDAPYRTYGALGPERDANGRSIRTQRPTDAFAVAERTFRLLQRGDIRWSAREKHAWLELLLHSRGATWKTRTLARAFYKLFAGQSPAAGEHPFILTPRLLLTFTRTCLPPLSTSPDARAFAEKILGDFVRLVASPDSPYGTAKGTIQAYSLTALAEAYVMLGDRRSAAQVSLRLFAQKMLPDAKDVAVVAASRTGISSKQGRELFRELESMGAKLDYDTFKSTVFATMRSRNEIDSRRAALSALANLAHDQLREKDAEKLQDLIDRVASVPHSASTVVMTTRNEQGNVGAATYRSVLNNHLASGQLSDAIRLYRLMMHRGIIDPEAFESVMSGVLRLQRSSATQRRYFIETGTEFIEHAFFQPTPFLRSSLALRKSLEFCVAVDDWEPVERIVSVAAQQNVKVNPILLEPFEEWASAKVGEDVVGELMGRITTIS